MNVDWRELWRQEKEKTSWQGKSKEDWNKRAAGFARRNSRSPYVDSFLAKVSVEETDTLLDVGCGPGTLSIPLAEKVKFVTALDFSNEMLDLLKDRCLEAGVDNVKAVEASWEDDWQAKGVGRHDVVIASRSLAVGDLGAALVKLNDWAQKKVILSDKTGAGPFDPAIFAAVGRRFEPGPDYIYTVNILYQMGIKARVDFISSGSETVYASKEEARDAWIWMLDEMNAEEHEKFVAHMDSRLVDCGDGTWTLKGQTVPQWAVIQWDKVEI